MTEGNISNSKLVSSLSDSDRLEAQLKIRVLHFSLERANQFEGSVLGCADLASAEVLCAFADLEVTSPKSVGPARAISTSVC